jgi:hypothetical protein
LTRDKAVREVVRELIGENAPEPVAEQVTTEEAVQQ